MPASQKGYYSIIIVTGVAGFIGSNFVHDWLAQPDEPVINLDALPTLRRAAHGVTSEHRALPKISNSIAFVHNRIIENFESL